MYCWTIRVRPLNKSYAYDEDIPKYIEFLQTGLENYRKGK